MYLYSTYKDEVISIKSVSITNTQNTYSNYQVYKVGTNIDVTVVMDLLDFSYMRDIDQDMFIKDNIIIHDGKKYYTLTGTFLSNVFYDDYKYEAIVSLVVDIYDVDDELPSIIFEKLRSKTIDDILDI